MIVDHQLHWFPDAFYQALLGRRKEPRAEEDGAGGYILHMSHGGYFRVPKLFLDLDLVFEELDRQGIDAGVFSPALLADPGPFDAQQARELAFLLNEAYAEARQAWGSRFIPLATIPMHDPQIAVEVLDDAVTRLGLRGVLMSSNVGGRPVSTRQLRPVWERMAHLRAPVVLHPAMRSIALPALEQLGEDGPVLDRYLGGWFDASAAGLSLIVTGLLDDLPDLVVLQPHLGAMLPLLRGKFDMTEARFKTKAAEPSSWYFRHRFFTDTAAFDPPALKLAVDTYGIERVLYGSDYPPRLSYPEALSFVRENLPSEQADQVFGNVLPLLEPAAAG